MCLVFDRRFINGNLLVVVDVGFEESCSRRTRKNDFLVAVNMPGLNFLGIAFNTSKLFKTLGTNIHVLFDVGDARRQPSVESSYLTVVHLHYIADDSRCTKNEERTILFIEFLVCLGSSITLDGFVDLDEGSAFLGTILITSVDNAAVDISVNITSFIYRDSECLDVELIPKRCAEDSIDRCNVFSVNSNVECVGLDKRLSSVVTREGIDVTDTMVVTPVTYRLVDVVTQVRVSATSHHGFHEHQFIVPSVVDCIVVELILRWNYNVTEISKRCPELANTFQNQLEFLLEFRNLGNHPLKIVHQGIEGITISLRLRSQEGDEITDPTIHVLDDLEDSVVDLTDSGVLESVLHFCRDVEPRMVPRLEIPHSCEIYRIFIFVRDEVTVAYLLLKMPDAVYNNLPRNSKRIDFLHNLIKDSTDGRIVRERRSRKCIDVSEVLVEKGNDLIESIDTISHVRLSSLSEERVVLQHILSDDVIVSSCKLNHFSCVYLVQLLASDVDNLIVGLVTVVHRTFL